MKNEPPTVVGHPALFETTEEVKGIVRCGLCPHRCKLAPGECGLCRVRRNDAGRLITDTYRRPVKAQPELIENLPFGWFMPGSSAYTIGTYGCNLACKFCMNDQLSRASYPIDYDKKDTAPEDVVENAIRFGCESIAYAMNEPTVFYEYILEIAGLAKEAGLKNVLVTNGYILSKPRQQLYPLMDAINVDVKGFSDEFYQELCGGHLQPVLDSCEACRKMGKHLEITNLLIPRHNDSGRMIGGFLDWAADRLGKDVPIHYTAYVPAGGFNAPPTTAISVLSAANAASLRGFTRVRTSGIGEMSEVA